MAADTIILTGVVSELSVVLNGSTGAQQIVATGSVSQQGPQGEPGAPGESIPGDPGVGVPNGGTAGQVLIKASSTDYDTNWHSPVKADVGLGNADNTSDTNKPISTATQTALDAKADESVAINAGTGLTGGGDLSTSRTLSIADVAVTPGSYTNADITVNEKGQVTAAANGSAGSGDVAAAIHAASSKTTPVDADELGVADSAASFGLKKLTWANLKATLKTYFDTLYASIAHTHAQSDVTNLTTDLAAKVPTTRTVNGHALSSNVTVMADDVLPTQSGQSGKFLSTDGSTASWDTPSVGAAASRFARMGWVFPDSTINAATDLVAEIWHTVSAMWYELETDGDLLIRDSSSFGTNFYYTAANALLVRENATVALVNVSSGNATGVNALTTNSGKRSAAIATLTAFCDNNNFDGVDLDLETFQVASMSAGQYTDFKTFLQELGDALHAKGLILSVEVPPIWNTAANTESGTGDAWDSANSQSYYRLVYSDFNTLPVDMVVIMAYDYQYDYSAGEPNQPLKWLEEILRFARQNIDESRTEIVAGIPAAGYSGATGGYSITGRTYDYLAAQTGFGGASRDAASGELIWANAGTSYAAIDDTAVQLKVERAGEIGIFKYGLWHIGDNQYGGDSLTYVHPHNQKGSAFVKNSGAETIAGAKTFSADITVPDEAYDATAWNGSLEAPTKNAVRDKIETLQPLDSDLTTIAGLTATTDNFLVAVASAWASRTPSQVRTTLALVIGTNVQAWSAALDTWAGKTAPSGTVVGTTDTQALSNKEVTKRVVTTTDDATAVIDYDVTDVYELSAIANNTTFTLTGSPTDGQEIWVRYKDTGVSKTLTWTGFTAIGVTLPTSTTAGKWGYVKCMYNSAASQLHVLAVGTQA